MDSPRVTSDRAPVALRSGRGPAVAMPWMASATALAALSLLTHAANFGFTIAGGRLLDPADFGTLTALLGIVLVGMAPGMAVQALTAAGTLGAPTAIDGRLARRLALVIAAVVATLLLAIGDGIGVDGTVTVLAITAAAGLLPLTAANEGLLQGGGRYAALGVVMVVGAGVKLGVGLLGMALLPVTWVAACAVALGYLGQLAASHRSSGGLTDVAAAPRGHGPLVSAVAMMGLLLVVIHLDAVLATLLLDDLEAGRYAVGVVGARVVFWAPQFVLLLLYPRLVVDGRRRVVVAAVGALAAAGTIAAGVAVVLGPTLVQVVFGATFEPVGAWLWRFAWVGTAALGLQVLTLSDLATGRREAMGVLGVLLVALVGTLLGLRPTDPVQVVTVVATLMTVAVAVGLVRRLAHRSVDHASATP